MARFQLVLAALAAMVTAVSAFQHAGSCRPKCPRLRRHVSDGATGLTPSPPPAHRYSPPPRDGQPVGSLGRQGARRHPAHRVQDLLGRPCRGARVRGQGRGVPQGAPARTGEEFGRQPARGRCNSPTFDLSIFTGLRPSRSGPQHPPPPSPPARRRHHHRCYHRHFHDRHPPPPPLPPPGARSRRRSTTSWAR